MEDSLYDQIQHLLDSHTRVEVLEALAVHLLERCQSYDSNIEHQDPFDSCWDDIMLEEQTGNTVHMHRCVDFEVGILYTRLKDGSSGVSIADLPPS